MRDKGKKLAAFAQKGKGPPGGYKPRSSRPDAPGGSTPRSSRPDAPMAPQATHTGPKRIALEPTPQLPKEAFSGPKAHEAYAAVIKSHAKNAETARKVGDKPTAAHFTAKAAGMARNAAEKGHGHIEQGAKGGQYYVTPSGAKHYIGG